MKLQNKKVKNATKIIYDGIQFRSKLEAYTYQKFKENGIKVEYENKKFTLLPSFEFHNEKVRAITYLPDFVGNNFIVECKGFPTDTFPLKEKLFKRLLVDISPNCMYYVVHTQKEVNTLVEQLKQKIC